MHTARKISTTWTERKKNFSLRGRQKNLEAGDCYCYADESN